MLPEKTIKKLALIYTLLILLVSVLPINSSSSSLNNNYLVTIRLDYLFHAILYIPWIVLVWLAHSRRIRTSPMKILGWVVLSVLFAASMECVQYLLPYRSYNINDLLANLVGVMGGYLCMVLAGVWKKREA